jgi:hypothetical protein
MPQPEQIANADFFEESFRLFFPVEAVSDQLENGLAVGGVRL